MLEALVTYHFLSSYAQKWLHINSHQECTDFKNCLLSFFVPFSVASRTNRGCLVNKRIASLAPVHPPCFDLAPSPSNRATEWSLADFHSWQLLRPNTRETKWWPESSTRRNAFLNFPPQIENLYSSFEFI